MICEQCGIEYQPRRKNPKRKYCSVECSNKAKIREVTKKCERCGTEYTIKACVAKRQRYCSKLCSQEAKKKKRLVKECLWCGKKFEVIPSHAWRTHCSVKCANADMTLKSRRCTNCGRTFFPKTGRQKTCSTKCAGQKRVKQVDKTCEVCGRRYTVKWNRRHKSRFCSRECMGRSNSKVKNRPTKIQLQHLLMFKTMAEIGRDYGVTPNAVRYWCIQYGIKWPGHKERVELRKMNSATKTKLINETIFGDEP